MIHTSHTTLAKHGLDQTPWITQSISDLSFVQRLGRTKTRISLGDLGDNRACSVALEWGDDMV